MTSSTSSAESELRRMLESLGYKFVPSDQVSKATSLILTYSERDKLIAAITAHLEAVVRSAEIKEAQRLAQKCINHTEHFYDGDGDTYKAVRVGQITHELNNRLAQLRRTPATGSNQGADHEV